MKDITLKSTGRLVYNGLLQPQKALQFLLWVLLPASCFFYGAVWVLHQQGFGVVDTIRDMAQSANVSSFLGFVSNIGIWLWVSAAAISFFAAFSQTGNPNAAQRSLLILTGLFSLLLAVDDFFMIHDRYVNQKIIYGLYAVCAGLLLLKHFTRILQIDGVAFVLACGLLGASVLTDLLQFVLPMSYTTQQLIEEGFKFSGGAGWLYFSCKSARYKPF